MYILFYILFSFVPLIFLPNTYELFEFNKMIAVYILTVLIATFWIIEMIKQKKIIFRRTLLDIPLLIFLSSQILSTIFSVDLRTSLLGYYSRFNGGLLSIVCYLILYWAFVSNMDRQKALKSIYLLLLSSLLVSIYAVLERFGIDKNLWVQDVQNRVFSTLGQPNWLASWVAALIPIPWALSLKEKLKSRKFWMYFSLSLLLFLVLLFTKSRSGLLGFIATDLIFWGYVFLKYKKEFLSKTIICNLSFVFLVLFIGTAWNPSLNDLLTHKKAVQTTVQGPALETGGTESGTIRKIVWKGALRVWGHYPILGSGVETFAFSYYGFRPQEHNLVSEWDFLYNKAHNEYLNFAATSGTFGFLSYLSLVGFIIFLLIKKIDKGEGVVNLLPLSFLAGFSSLLISNFFGFSTVATQIEFFLLPAFAVSLSISSKEKDKKTNNLDNNQRAYVSGVVALTAIIIYLILGYWHADTLFSKGKRANEAQNYTLGQEVLIKAVKLSSKEAIFRNELANSYAGIALSLAKAKNNEDVETFIKLAISESNKAVSLSPANINLLRSQAGIYLRLAGIDLKYLGPAKDALLRAVSKAPTDAKLFYNLALIYTRTNEADTAVKILDEVIKMKNNYKDARYLYALIMVDRGNIEAARNQLNYILEKIDPNDLNSQNLLKKI